MAQNELSEKIRAVAQAKGVDPELAVKIALAESGLNPAASAPKLSSAKGLFGVIDSTWKQFGGKPGQQTNPDENIRVGTDVIASNTDFLRKNLGRDPSPSEIYAAHFFGPTGAKNFLAADMKAPAESVFSKEVLKANPQLQGKTVGDIRQMLAGKMGEKPAARTTQQAKTAPTDSEQMMKKALESGISAQVGADQLGSGYKAALALSFLGADEADEPEDEGRLQARLDKEADDQQMAELAAYKPYNALKDLDLSSAPQVPVQRMAAGGLPFSPVPTVRQSARQQLDAIKADYDKYNTAAGDYNAALQKYKSEQYDPYVKAVEDYNKAAEVWNAGPRTTDFTGVMPTAPAEFSMTSPTAPTVSQADYEAMARSAQKDVAGRRLAIEAVSDPERFGLSLPKFFDKGGDVSAEQGLIPDEPTVRPMRMANRQMIGDKEIQNMMMGLGVDQGMLGISLDKMKMGEKENLARNLMAMYNAKMGDLGVNAALIRPLDAPPGVYVGNIGASYPVGQGRLMAGVNAMRTPEGGTQTMGHSLGYSGQVGPGYLDAQIMQPKGYPQGRSAQVQYRIPFSHGGAVHRADGSPETGEVKEPWLPRVGTYSEKTAWEMYPGQMGQFDQQDAARHMLATGTLTRKYGETAAEMLGKLHEITTSPLRWIGSKMKLTQMPVDYEQDLHNNRVGIELGKRSKSQKDLEDLVQLEAERARNEQTPGTAWIGRPVRPVKRSDGSPETGEQIGPYIGNPNIQRQGAKARALAEKRDVNLLPDPKTYAAVAGLMGVPPNELGFSVLHPQYQQIQQVAEPAFVAGTALGIAPLAAPVVRGGARMVGSALNERMLAGQSLTPGINTPAPINFAVKPRGGVFATSGSVDQPVLSHLDEVLDEYAAQMQRAMPKASPEFVKEFVDKKVRKYLTTSYGTANDPIRQGLRSGELPLHGKDLESFPEYLLSAARDPNAPGHAQAKRHLEKFYDDLVNMQARIFTKGPKRETVDSQQAIKEQERTSQLMTQEGLPQEFQNPIDITTVSPEDIAQYSYSYGNYGNLLKARQEGRLPSGQAYAIEHGQPIYDVRTPSILTLRPDVVAQNIAALPANKLKNMSFEQAVIEGAKILQPRRNYQVAVERASKGLSVPKESLEMYTKPQLSTETGQWVRITDPVATELEGKLMHHSVGGYSDSPKYGHGGTEGFKSGRAQVFSFRNKDTNLPETTIEAEKTDKGLTISQIKGNYNSFPSHRSEEIFQFLQKNPEINNIKSEFYLRDSKGNELPKPIRVDWGRSFDNWQQGLGNEWVVTRDDPGGIEYVWGLTQNKAAGGLIERQNTDNRRYM